jgi:hypothetical protein
MYSFPHPPLKTALTSKLLSQDSIEVIADFCFPNGVYAKQIAYDFDRSLED